MALQGVEFPPGLQDLYLVSSRGAAAAAGAVVLSCFVQRDLSPSRVMPLCARELLYAKKIYAR